MPRCGCRGAEEAVRRTREEALASRWTREKAMSGTSLGLCWCPVGLGAHIVLSYNRTRMRTHIKIMSPSTHGLVVDMWQRVCIGKRIGKRIEGDGGAVC